MFGIPRNVLFAVGGAALAGVLYVGFSGGDEPQADQAADKNAKEKGAKKKRAKGGQARAQKGQAAKPKPLCERLACTEEQAYQVDAALAEFELATLEAKRARRLARAATAAAVRAAEVDPAELDEALDNAATQQDAIEAGARNALVLIHGILDEAQRDRLAKIVATDRLSAVLLGVPEDDRDPKEGKRKRRKKGTRQGEAGVLDAVRNAGAPLAPGIADPSRNDADDANAANAADDEPLLDPDPAADPAVDPE